LSAIDTQTHVPPIGTRGEPCEECGSPLAEDQRYCLVCGSRRGGARVAYAELLGRSGGEAPARLPAEGPERDWTPIVALGGLGGLALVLVVGVLIGKSFNGGGGGHAAQVIRLGPGSATGAGTGSGSNVSTATTGSFKGDWPAGKQGWTVELGSLDKQSATGAQVATAKADATKKGVAAVGALDSDQYPSLPPGKYIVYSGVYSAKADAAKALKGIKAKYPSAQVIQVSSKKAKGDTSYLGKQKATLNKQQLSTLNNTSGAAYEKQLKKLPKTIVLPGKPPKADHKAPGGGSGGGQVIK
jgi:hypothetical protein